MSRNHPTGSGLGLSTGLVRASCRNFAIRAAIRRAAIEVLETRMLLSNTWFVATNGSDQNPGTIDAPFRTIQHAADESVAGDTVDIRGGVYHENVAVHDSGTPGNPIVFEAYDGESVTIDGADAVTDWTPSAGSIWTAPMNWDLGTGNNQVFVDGQMINEARWPNTSLDLSHPTLAVADSGSTTATSATIYDAALTQPGGFWVGATMHVDGGQEWVMRGETVTASGPGWVTFTYDRSNSAELPQRGNHFYLTGIAGALDSPGEWYRSSDGTLSLWTTGSDNPTNHVIEVKARKYAFDLSNASYIDIEDVNIFAATINTNARSRSDSIDHITAEYLSQFDATSNGWVQPTDAGIALNGAGDSLSNSVIAYSAGDGVYVSGPGSVVTNNLIHDVDYQAGESGGVNVNALHVTVDHNTIYNCGRSGIVDRYGSDRILYNIVHDFGLQTTDCGGIYTFGCNGNGAEFAYNTIYDGVTGGFGGVGVYLDNNSSGFTVDHNITYNVNTGLKINMSSENEMIFNNTFDGTSHSVDKTWGAADWSGTVIQNNLFPHSTAFGVGATFSNNMANKGYFMNAPAGDYELAAGSPAIAAGSPLAAFTNAVGQLVPDIGALKYGATPFSNGAVMSALPPDPSSHFGSIIGSTSQTSATEAARQATSSILGVNFDAKRGTETARDGGLGNNFAGNWVEYANVDFGSGVSSVQLQLALDNRFAGQTIALRLDSPAGPTIGSLVTTGTGGWTTYAAEAAAISGASGVHNLFLVMLGSGAIANVQSFKFAA